MRYSIMTEPQLGGTYQDLLAAARLAETEDLTSFARSDHWYWEGRPRPATDAFATLAGLARETSTIRLCVLVTPVTFRNPATIAKNAATIDEMSQGRFDLGVGTGWNEFEHDALGLRFPDWPERYSRLEETLDYLEAAFSPGQGRYEGGHYRLDADVLPEPSSLRMIVGGTGPDRTPRLAGARADEYNLILTTPEITRERVNVMRGAAGDRAVEVTVMGQAHVGRSDREYASLLERRAAERGRSTAEIEQRWRETGQIHGTTSQAAEQIAALEECGVERFYLQWLDLPDYDGLATMVEAVRGR